MQLIQKLWQNTGRIWHVRADHFKSHHLEELAEVDGAGSILANCNHHLCNFLLLGLKTKSTHGNLQLLGINGAGAIGVEQIERFTNLLLSLFSQFELITHLLAEGVGTTVCVSLREQNKLRTTCGSKTSRTILNHFEA
jgi:hypothetical protein